MIVMIYNAPTWLLAAVIVGGFAAFALASHYLMRRWIGNRARDSSDTIGVIVLATATLYAVLLAMIAVAAWANYSETESRVREEANIAGNLYRDAEGLPNADRLATRLLLRDYVTLVAEQEFPAMKRGEHPNATSDVAAALMVQSLGFRPSSLGESNVQARQFNEIDRLFELRRIRQETVRTGLLSVLWWVVIAGGAVTIMMAALLIAEDDWLSYVLCAGLAVMIGMLVFLIVAVDRPLMGGVSVDAVAFEQVGQRMDALDKTLRRAEPTLEGSVDVTRTLGATTSP